MLHVGLDLSRKRVDVRVLDQEGRSLLVTTASPDAGGLRVLAAQVARVQAEVDLADRGLVVDDDGVVAGQDGPEVQAVIESMTGARFVRDVLVEQCGWQVLVADAARVKGMASVACKTDRKDAMVLAELSRRDMVPAIWLPGTSVRQDREQTRYRAHLVKHRSMLKQRIHATLMTCGVPNSSSDPFGAAGRAALAGMRLPEPWKQDVDSSLELIDFIDGQLNQIDAVIRGWAKDRPEVARLQTIPGIGTVLSATIVAEIGDISRFPSPQKLIGYAGLAPKVYQSGNTDRRGTLSKAGPKPLRWALIEASTIACTNPAFSGRYRRLKARTGDLGRNRQVARIDLARHLAQIIWIMLTREEDFRPNGPGHARTRGGSGTAPAGAANDLAA